ncbi:MAG TPA: 4'-phosphopantetheinyl transferase superfamily protein [Gaiellaceae bacterium]|nr:4'-phosphopantetheinyl transferase superfamily protein [Gaiellaceae bacterium]
MRSVDVDVWPFPLDGRDLMQSVLAGYAGADVRFSVSRSGTVGLLAVTRGRAVGVDVERIEPRRALGPIADQLFAADEAAELRALPEETRVARFYALWTRKEAYAKALGTGLAVPLGRLRPAYGWSVHDLPLGSEYAGAVCVRGWRARVRLLA